MPRKKFKDVPKFGGNENLGKVKMYGDTYDAESIEVKSKTTLEEDTGYGNAVVIRQFEFNGNPEIWREHPPTKQELFNYHLKGIEISLWRDGLQVFDDVEPRLLYSDSMKYSIFIAAVPARGHLLNQTPKTLTQLVHGNTD